MGKTDFGKLAAKLMSRFSQEKIIEIVIPMVAPMIINQIPQLAQAGFTPQTFMGLLKESEPENGPAQADIPDGGYRALFREWANLSPDQVAAGVNLILSDQSFDGIVEGFGNILYYAIGLSELRKQQENSLPASYSVINKD